MFPFALVLLFVLRLRFPPGSSVRRVLISRYGQTGLIYVYFMNFSNEHKFSERDVPDEKATKLTDFNIRLPDVKHIP